MIFFFRLSLLAVLLALVSCGEKMAPAGIMGYNHTADRSIFTFSVNGRGGHNMAPGGGGGSESCCVSLPVKWRPGLKAKIEWVYQGGTEIPPPPPPQEIEVEIPEYKHHGSFQVHFYDNHQVKVVVSPCNIGHPFHPLNLQDQLPWTPEFSKEEAIESYKKGGPSYDC